MYDYYRILQVSPFIDCKCVWKEFPITGARGHPRCVLFTFYLSVQDNMATLTLVSNTNAAVIDPSYCICTMRWLATQSKSYSFSRMPSIKGRETRRMLEYIAS